MWTCSALATLESSWLYNFDRANDFGTNPWVGHTAAYGTKQHLQLEFHSSIFSDKLSGDKIVRVVRVQFVRQGKLHAATTGVVVALIGVGIIGRQFFSPSRCCWLLGTLDTFCAMLYSLIFVIIKSNEHLHDVMSLSCTSHAVIMHFAHTEFCYRILN